MTTSQKHTDAEPTGIAYRVFRNADVNALMKDVTNALNNKWQLAGGVSVTTIDGFPFFAQAVVFLP
jgi:hypothetical protein